ncbi:hypothetical protein [Neorhizobium petrolearium]|uniref:Lipoprotein n=1 Tax=Neorhizobium petrolearium TaxID=515361 RepID=A0ABY8LZS4_9HYPH|nr:hypothetical protein [Neorhizobium petrolearium]MCC2612631.1 hypothetical protein [Neorhizobium petrolearium]WGI67754.1 hypothetical protein QEO92_22655 [Neorhizobium petrolearium]
MFRNAVLILSLSATIAGCQSKPTSEPVNLPNAATYCAIELKKLEPRSKVEIAGWTRSKTDIYGPAGPAEFTLDNQEKLIEIPYAVTPKDEVPGQAWRACMLKSGYDTTKINLTF